MSTNPEKSFLQKAIGKLGNYLDWIKETLKNDDARREFALNLGLNPNEEIKFPDQDLSNIDKYRKAVDPDEEAYQSALGDVTEFYNATKEYIKLYGISDDADEFTYRFFELLGTNYVRLKYPKTYYLSQLMGFIIESRVSAPKAKEEEGIVLSNIWNFLSTPFSYGDDLLKFLFTSGEGYLLILAGFWAAMEKEGHIQGSRFLYSWDALPREWTEENNKDVQDSFHGENFLNQLRNEFEDTFSIDDDDEEAWKKINKALKENDPSDIQKKIVAAYQATVEKWKRGTWFDTVSENAFSFDIKFPEEEDSTLEKYLGGTIVWVPKEDAPSDVGEIDGIRHEHTDGFLFALNGEANLKYALSDKWELVIESASGNLLDIYLGGVASADILGDLQIKASIQSKVDPETGATYSIPEKTGNRFQVGTINVTAFLSKNDFGLEIGLKDNAVVISGNGTDGFLEEILPSSDVPLKFSIAAGVSKKKGFYINHDVDAIKEIFKSDDNEEAPEERGITARGAGPTDDTEEPKLKKEKTALEKLFPIHKDMGFINFESVKWSYGATAKNNKYGVNLSVLSTFSSKLGPVYVKIKNAGLSMEVSMPKEELDLSKLDFSFGYKLPSAVALRIESGVITGGGFLDIDEKNHRYAGVLYLKFWKIELTAIGLINTRLPNNQKGFSMLVTINVVFNPGFNLGFGFTLAGVGGLVGIHRTMKVDVLRKRIQKGAVQSIMFPKDVIKNAPKIISDLRAIFPPRKNHYVFAPFLKIGWGTPSIVEVDLGVLWEHPFKSRLILIGHVAVYLPNKNVDKRLTEIHVDIFGDFNFGASSILIEGRLRDSHVVGIALTGGFAFMMDWGQDSKFLFSIGGYHPRYKKPARFPSIPRLTAVIKRGGFSLSCQMYQAITSNSFQIGIRADLIVKYGSVSVTGLFEFNALLQWDPFYFETDIHISVALKYKSRNFAGVELYFLLSGPKPWKAKGYAKIKILFFSLKVRFNKEWGGQQKALPSAIEANILLDRLREQLSEAGNWAMVLPDNFNAAEPLRKIDESEKKGLILAHPSSNLEVRQRLLPLNKTIEKLGNSTVNGKPRFKISAYQLGDQGKESITASTSQFKAVFEQFSRGQFEDIPDAKKLSTPDFDPMQSGIRLAANHGVDFAKSLQFSTADFEDIIIRPDGENTKLASGENWQEKSQLKLNKTQRFRSGTQADFNMIDDIPDLQDTAYKVVSKNNLEENPADLENNYFKTYSKAMEYMQTNLADKQSEWQIVPTEALMAVF